MKIEYHHYHHLPEIAEIRKEMEHLHLGLTRKMERILANMQQLRDAVARNTSVDASVLTLVQNIAQQLKDAQASNDPNAIDELIAQLDANTQQMADAVKANTPAENNDNGTSPTEPPSSPA